MLKMSVAVKQLTFLAVVIHNVNSKTGFIKEDGMDTVFPPINTRSLHKEIPDGHLRPLGWQRKPDGKVREEKDLLDPSTFQQKYVKMARPVVLRGLLKHAPEAWEEDSKLKAKYGLVNITITVKKELIKKKLKRHMLLRKFLLDYMYENWYLACTVPLEMMGELPLPDVLSCGTFKERLVEAELWMSSGGTTSSLHSHNDHNIHCVLDGRKDFILIEGRHKAIFNYEETYPNSGAGSSPLDMDMVNMFKNKKIANVPWTWSTLHQGDCLFVPAGYLHQVRSYGRGISYTTMFAPSVEFDSSDCNKEEPHEPQEKKKRRRKPRRGKDDEKSDSKETKEESGNKEEQKKPEHLSLADAQFVWSYTGGERHLNETKLEPATLRHLLFLMLKDGDLLYIEQFEHFYQEALYMDSEKPAAEEVFNILTPEKDVTFLSREDITSIETSRLEHVCEIFNARFQPKHDEL